MSSQPVAVIFGAGEGLGGAIARRFAYLEQVEKKIGPKDGLLQPDDLAEIYWMLHSQARSAWTFDVVARYC